MLRTIVIAAFWTLAAASAQADDLACARADAADTVAVTKAPASFAGLCVRLRGMLRRTDDDGVTIAAVVRPGDAPPPRLTVFLENGNVPINPVGQDRFVELMGRVLSCPVIRKRAEDETAAASQKANPNPQDGNDTVYVHTSLGLCRNADDGFALFASRYRTVAAPPPAR